MLHSHFPSSLLGMWSQNPEKLGDLSQRQSLSNSQNHWEHQPEGTRVPGKVKPVSLLLSDTLQTQVYCGLRCTTSSPPNSADLGGVGQSSPKTSWKNGSTNGVQNAWDQNSSGEVIILALKPTRNHQRKFPFASYWHLNLKMREEGRRKVDLMLSGVTFLCNQGCP